MGHTTVIFTTLFFILQAKGFSYTSPCSPGPPPPPTPPSPEYSAPSISKISPGAVPPTHNHGAMGSEPPSPPPDPGSDSADDTPRRKPWWLLLLLIVFAAGAYIYLTRSPDSSVVLIAKTLSGQIVSTMENCILDGWTAATSGISTAKIYISLHGQSYCKILLLGVATHCICVIVFVILVRLRLCLARNNLTSHLKNFLCPFLFPILPFVYVPRLNRILWMQYYLALIHGELPAVRDIYSDLVRFLSYLSTTPPPQVSTIMGIISVHVCAIGLRAAFILVSGFPLATKTILQALSNFQDLCIFFCFCLGQTILAVLIFGASAAFGQHRDYVLDWLHSQPSPYQPAGDPPWSDSELFLGHYRHWKSIQIQDFHELAPRFKFMLLATLKASLEIWHELPFAQKLLITTPAVIFYGYRYFMPKARSVSRRVPRLIRNWRRP
ncbi:hypothetical protein C8F04DRAFT_1178988 [Mycena alexandri]|uniref:Uncharacterized protein n=1 Tax=Mycena alexandri TaxID=1745969 RepID=A0AAD6X7F8_9AGAR|nr:hypothetical protein C8F04DRAFT_1178988 [Mycena alexandri]